MHVIELQPNFRAQLLRNGEHGQWVRQSPRSMLNVKNNERQSINAFIITTIITNFRNVDNKQ